MKPRLILCGFIASLLAGCASETTSKFTPIENGFGYVTHVRGLTDRSLSADIWYQDSNGKRTAVWPYLQVVWGNNLVITNNTIVLIGGNAELYKDGNERLKLPPGRQWT
jgi:hypothetical protein